MDKKVNISLDVIDSSDSGLDIDKPHKVRKKLKAIISLVQFSNRLMNMVKFPGRTGSRESLQSGGYKTSSKKIYKKSVNYFYEESDDAHPLSNVSLTNKYLKIIKSDHILKGPDFIGLFFAKIHCERCDQLLPLLTNVQKEARKLNKLFEIIAVCNDSTTEEIVSWFKTNRLPWYGVIAEDHMLLGLTYAYSILAVPQLIVLDHQGYVISRNSVDDLNQIGIDVTVSWFS